jgi:hypothetical protein
MQPAPSPSSPQMLSGTSFQLIRPPRPHSCRRSSSSRPPDLGSTPTPRQQRCGCCSLSIQNGGYKACGLQHGQQYPEHCPIGQHRQEKPEPPEDDLLSPREIVDTMRAKHGVATSDDLSKLRDPLSRALMSLSDLTGHMDSFLLASQCLTHCLSPLLRPTGLPVFTPTSVSVFKSASSTLPSSPAPPPTCGSSPSLPSPNLHSPQSALFTINSLPHARFVSYLHRCFGSPSLSTFLRALSRGYIRGIPLLTSTLVRKFSPLSLSPQPLVILTS